jgi:hypothetical protein
LQALQGLLALLTQLLLLRAQAQGFAFGHGVIVDEPVMVSIHVRFIALKST